MAIQVAEERIVRVSESAEYLPKVVDGPTALPPLLLRAAEAGVLCGRSLASWYRDNAAGRVPAPVRIGGAVRWRRAELERWVEAGCPDRATWEKLRAAQEGGR